MAAPLHILVVDDEPLAAEAMAAFLARRGYRVSIAPGGNKALAIHRGDPADLVVTDIRMPEGDGLFLISALRKSRKDLPIIVVTGQVDVDGNAPPTEFRQVKVMNKPVMLRKLGALVDEMAGSVRH